MFDFLNIVCTVKRGHADIEPDFDIVQRNDLLIRAGDFYAAWIEETGLWSTNELDVFRIIDREMEKYAEENQRKWDGYTIHYMRNNRTDCPFDFFSFIRTV